MPARGGKGHHADPASTHTLKVALPWQPARGVLSVPDVTDLHGAAQRATTSRASFAALVPLHTEAMLRVAAALVGPADAEDATQEAAVRAWQAWDTLRDINALRPWLLRITANVCRQWQRGGFGRRARLVEPLPEESGELLAVLDADADADPGTSAHAGTLDLRREVNALGEDLRLVVMLRYYAGMDATEVGEALGLPPGTVRTRLKRALERLRARLGTSSDSSGKLRGGEGGQRV
jgi:RNA polymerase sigma-70 factor (ECF subfamily)